MALRFPILGDDAAETQNCAQGILQPYAISGLLPNLNVKDKAQDSPFPIRTAPGRRLVQNPSRRMRAALGACQGGFAALRD